MDARAHAVSLRLTSELAGREELIHPELSTLPLLILLILLTSICIVSDTYSEICIELYDDGYSLQGGQCTGAESRYGSSEGIEYREGSVTSSCCVLFLQDPWVPIFGQNAVGRAMQRFVFQPGHSIHRASTGMRA